MTDREIKMMVKQAYISPETEKEKRFVRKHERRALKLSTIIKLEFRYMGVKSFLTGAAFLALLLMAAQTGDTDVAWIFASFIPVYALIPMLLLSRSERFGMDELEAASRFSLRYIRIVRMFILGLFSMAVLVAAGVILRAAAYASFTDQIILVVFPYLISAYGAMLVTRKWHGKDNIFGVLAVCAFSGLLPFVLRSVRLSGQLPNGVFLLMIVLLLAAMIREGRLYVKESEDLSWNLC